MVTEKVSRILQEITKDSALETYFFQKLGSTDKPFRWLEILNERGYFDPQNNPIPQIVDEKEESYVIPHWNVLGYFENLSKHIKIKPNKRIIENFVEIIDSIIMAYKISENDKVLLPSFVNTEGFNQSHTYELVDLPEPEDIDKFLPRYYQPKHIFIDTNYPICTTSAGMYYPNFKWQQYTAMQEAKNVINEVCQEYGKLFGRYYDLVEAYKTEDAEFIVVGMGSIVGLLREKVDEYRQND